MAAGCSTVGGWNVGEGHCGMRNIRLGFEIQTKSFYIVNRQTALTSGVSIRTVVLWTPVIIYFAGFGELRATFASCFWFPAPAFSSEKNQHIFKGKICLQCQLWLTMSVAWKTFWISFMDQFCSYHVITLTPRAELQGKGCFIKSKFLVYKGSKWKQH